MDPESYADRLAIFALRIVGAVHDDGPDSVHSALIAARSLIPPRGTNPDEALIVTIAAMVDPNRSRSELFAWTHRLDGGTAALFPQKPVTYQCNPLAVEMALNRVLPASALNPAEIDETIRILTRRGLTPPQIADHLDAELTDVMRWTGAAHNKTGQVA